MFREPEVDDGEERQDRRDRPRDRHPDDHHLLAIGDDRSWSEGAGGRIDDRDQASRDWRRLHGGRPLSRLIEEWRQGCKRPLELSDRRGQHDDEQPDDRQQEHAVDEEECRSATDPDVCPQPPDDRLQPGREDHGDEHQDDDGTRCQCEGK